VAAISADLMVGSIASMATQSFSANDGAPGGNSATVASGNWYLRHTTAGISLLDGLAAALVAAGVTNAAVVLLQNGLIKISGDNVFYLTWGSAAELKSMMGSTSNLSGASSYTMEEPSPLLLSPGYPFTTPEIANVDGYTVDDASRTPNADFTDIETDYNNTGTYNEWSVDAVVADRYRNTNTVGGNSFFQFRADVLVPGYRFFWYESATIDASSSSAMTWPTGTSVHGPYKARTVPRMPRVGKRKIENANDLWSFKLDGMKVSEYS